MFWKAICLAVSLALGLFGVGRALAQYPERPVILVVGYPAGGGTDIQSRLLMPYVEKYLGTSVIVENREGASGLVGATYIANAVPDGYTIGALNFPSMYSPIVQGNASYGRDAFTPLANQIGGVLALTVSKSSPITNAQEFVDLAKANPLVVGVTGVGHPSQIAALLFEDAAGVKFNFVPFNGGGPARIAMLGGHVTYGFMNLTEIFNDHRSGALRVLAVSGDERSPLAPDVPTFTQAGFDVKPFGILAGFGAPKGLSAEVEAKLVDAFWHALNDPDYIAEAQARELPTLTLSQSEFSAMLESNYIALTELWQRKPWTR